MGSGKVSLSLICVLSLAIMGHAQDSPQDIVDAHNKARAEVGVPPLVWNDTVAAFAQSYANVVKTDCVFKHSEDPRYGENIAMGWGSPEMSGLDAVKGWVDEEKPFYDYNTNSCSAGQMCGHYTQAVWANTASIGCAKVECDNEEKIFITCNYYPPGNYIGDKPY